MVVYIFIGFSFGEMKCVKKIAQNDIDIKNRTLCIQENTAGDYLMVLKNVPVCSYLTKILRSKSMDS
jgi:hypothetical protein